MNTPETTPTTTEIVTIARGHSVRHDGKTYSAGQRVTLPAADAARLRERGFIANPHDDTQADTQAADEENALTQGPTFETKTGPSVKQKR
ncbi:DUF7210 family protein [Paraburkholderia caffeinilytica]|uniref:DUF7210 family protein n=1 Tax=Paraburkholderia caffeinilytica TaxID=1761016 RepID=UPI003DA0410D